MKVDGRDDDGLRPIWGVGEVGRGGDFAAFHFQQELGARCLASGGIGLDGIVIDAEMVDGGKQSDQIFTAAIPALADFFLGDIVPAATDP